MSIASNVSAIRARMAGAAKAAGRDPGEIQLCAATKMNDADAVRQAIAAGVDCCGENRVQELVLKSSQNAYAGAPVHFVGDLETNKVRQVGGHVDLIQSVDSAHLVQAINAEAGKQSLIQNVLLEVNIGREASKGGFAPEEILPFLEHIDEFRNIRVRGLMAIPPISHHSGENRKFFQEMLQLSVDITGKKYDNVSMDCLSMGMSDDFEDAIACGSTMIRVGTAIFGARDYVKLHQT